MSHLSPDKSGWDQLTHKFARMLAAHHNHPQILRQIFSVRYHLASHQHHDTSSRFLRLHRENACVRADIQYLFPPLLCSDRHQSSCMLWRNRKLGEKWYQFPDDWNLLWNLLNRFQYDISDSRFHHLQTVPSDKNWQDFGSVLPTSPVFQTDTRFLSDPERQRVWLQTYSDLLQDKRCHRQKDSDRG